MAELISIIVPVYNAEKTVEALMDSVVCQEDRDWEMILVDDGSRDASAELIARYASSDARIRLLRQKNAGAAAARNTALKAVHGDYVLFADSDDTLCPDALAALRKAMTGCELALAHFYFVAGHVTEEKGLLKGSRVMEEAEFFRELVRQPGTFYFSALWNKMYRADIIRENGILFDPFFDWGEDYAFNMQYNRFVHRTALVEQPVYRYVKNISGGSLNFARHLGHSFRVKARLYKTLKALYRYKGLYERYRWYVTRYIFNVTLTD